MDYKKIYNALIDRARNRVLDCYKEKHHIIPKCIGGTDDQLNLVDLTPEEHYVAHQLLVKLYPKHVGIARAVAMMISNRPNNKMYGWVRRRFSEAQSVAYSGEGNPQYGTKWIRNTLTNEVKKIKGDIPDGWVAGRSEIISNPPLKQKANKELYKQLYTEYYSIYSKHGFDSFVKITGYNKSKANLVQMFSRHVDNFVPQNGKKRK
jgi:hypothetical protein